MTSLQIVVKFLVTRNLVLACLLTESYQIMENEERGPTEPKSLDPNIEEEHRQERVEHVVKSIQVVQVSSLTYDPGTEVSMYLYVLMLII